MARGCRLVRIALVAAGFLACAGLSAQDSGSDILVFLDEIMPRHLAEYHVPGAAVTVVKDGVIAASRGYGLADLEAGTPVDPATTLFRIASVTKLLTWTAVMQLVERGLVDLDADVNDYLTSVQVPAAFGAPVTLRQLMTHTAGFEDVGIGTTRYADPGPGALAAYLAAHLPSRVRPPGTVVMYSNHGAALAGLVVAEVSGLPFEEYVEREILAPLGMDHTSALQPPPETIRPLLARSYVRAGETFRPTTYAIDLLGPAGGASASAEDIAAFMLAHLQRGAARGVRIIGVDTVELMHRQAFTYDPSLTGWALGFQELDHRGARALFHDGFFQGYVSLLVLAPEQGIGLFVAYNSSGGGEAVDELLTAFLDRFVSAESGPRSGSATDEGAAPAGRPPTGLYVPARRPYTTIEQLSRNIPRARATARDGGSLVFLGRRWDPVRAGLYADSTSDDLLGVLTDGRGRVTGVAVGSYTFDRLRFYQNPILHMVLALLSGGLLLSSLVVWPIRAARRRGGRGSPATSLGTAARWTAGTGAALALVAAGGIAFVLATSPLASSVPASLSVLTLLPFGVAAAGAASIVLTVLVWVRRDGTVFDRVFHTVVAAALVVVALLMQGYGAMGPHLG